MFVSKKLLVKLIHDNKACWKLLKLFHRTMQFSAIFCLTCISVSLGMEKYFSMNFPRHSKNFFFKYLNFMRFIISRWEFTAWLLQEFHFIKNKNFQLSINWENGNNKLNGWKSLFNCLGWDNSEVNESLFSLMALRTNERKQEICPILIEWWTLIASIWRDYVS